MELVKHFLEDLQIPFWFINFKGYLRDDEKIS